MPSNTTYTPQVALNKLAGNAALTGKSEHDVFNSANGSSGKTIQNILNTNKSATSITAQSTQAQLYAILKTPLSLTGPMTEYSEQTLLNMAFAASVPLLTVIGK